MKMFTEKLSQAMPQVPVDFYKTNYNVYFGEFTLFHFSGIVNFSPNR